MQAVAKPVEQVSVARAGLAARWIVIADWTLLAIGLVALQLWIPHDKFADGEVRFQELALLLDHGVLSPQRYSLIGPIFSAPLYLLGHLYSSPARWTVRYNSLLFTLSLLVVYW